MEGSYSIARGTGLVLALVLLLSLFIAPSSHAQEPDLKLSVTIYGEGNPDGTLFLRPDRISIAMVPILVNVTFVHNDTVSPQVPHNFRVDIRGEVYETPLVLLGESGATEFWINETGEYPYWCSVVGHRDLGMEGAFIVGQVAGEEPDGVEGLPLRAYWIGLIGIFSMIVVIIIAYFAIKLESRHHADHREHRRRGLP